MQDLVITRKVFGINLQMPKMNEKEILLLAPRGFCAGVDRAVLIVEQCLEKYGAPIYVNHEIVHNKFVVERLEKQGVIFEKPIAEIPEGSVYLLSAHGVSPKVVEEAQAQNLKIIDATCPLVTKVHKEAKRFTKNGYTILLIGHKKHVETQGTYGEAPSDTIIIETEDHARQFHPQLNTQYAYLTQTTLSLSDTSEIIKILQDKIPNLAGPQKSDICYATTNRQLTIKEFTNDVDMLLVVGSQNSSNSNRLREIGERCGITSYLIDSKDELQRNWFDKVTRVAISAGASAPEVLISDVVKELQLNFNFSKVVEMTYKEENISFAIPAELK